MTGAHELFQRCGGDIHRGALWSLIYFVLTVAIAFWWFRRKDVLS